MKKIIKEDIEIERFTLPKEKALELMKDEPYKVELIEDLPEGEVISFYKQGEFTDLCAGAHVPTTGKIKAFALIIHRASAQGRAKDLVGCVNMGHLAPAKGLQRKHGKAHNCNQQQADQLCYCSFHIRSPSLPP